MAKWIFISFAIEDRAYRNFLVGQAMNENSPFQFVDMSVKNHGRLVEAALPDADQGLRRGR